MIQINVRIDEKSLEELERLVRDGEFTNVSEGIRYCIRKQLKSFEEKGRSPPPLRMTLLDVVCWMGREGGLVVPYPKFPHLDSINIL